MKKLTGKADEEAEKGLPEEPLGPSGKEKAKDY